jgi:hypothetical protein
MLFISSSDSDSQFVTSEKELTGKVTKACISQEPCLFCLIHSQHSAPSAFPSVLFLCYFSLFAKSVNSSFLPNRFFFHLFFRKMLSCTVSNLCQTCTQLLDPMRFWSTCSICCYLHKFQFCSQACGWVGAQKKGVGCCVLLFAF